MSTFFRFCIKISSLNNKISPNSQIIIYNYLLLANKKMIVFDYYSYSKSPKFLVYDNDEKWNEMQIKVPLFKNSTVYIDKYDSIYVYELNISINFYKITNQGNILNLNSTSEFKEDGVIVSSCDKLYFIGGSTSVKSLLEIVEIDVDTIDIYNIELNCWNRSKSNLSLKRHGLSAVTLLNNKILIMGGFNYSTNEIVDICELYDPFCDKISIVDSMNIPRSGHTSALLPNGHVITCGGFNADCYNNLNSFELYNPYTNKWQIFPIFLPMGILFANVFSLNRLEFIVVGKNGNRHEKKYITSVYNYIKNTWDIDV